MKLSINEEIVVLCMRALKKIDPTFDVHELYTGLKDLTEKHCQDWDLVAIIASWGDTLKDQEVAELLRIYVESSQIFSKI